MSKSGTTPMAGAPSKKVARPKALGAKDRTSVKHQGRLHSSSLSKTASGSPSVSRNHSREKMESSTPEMASSSSSILGLEGSTKLEFPSLGYYKSNATNSARIQHSVTSMKSFENLLSKYRYKKNDNSSRGVRRKNHTTNTNTQSVHDTDMLRIMEDYGRQISAADLLQKYSIPDYHDESMENYSVARCKAILRKYSMTTTTSKDTSDVENVPENPKESEGKEAKKGSKINTSSRTRSKPKVGKGTSKDSVNNKTSKDGEVGQNLVVLEESKQKLGRDKSKSVPTMTPNNLRKPKKMSVPERKDSTSTSSNGTSGRSRNIVQKMERQVVSRREESRRRLKQSFRQSTGRRIGSGSRNVRGCPVAKQRNPKSSQRRTGSDSRNARGLAVANQRNPKSSQNSSRTSSGESLSDSAVKTRSSADLHEEFKNSSTPVTTEFGQTFFHNHHNFYQSSYDKNWSHFPNWHSKTTPFAPNSDIYSNLGTSFDAFYPNTDSVRRCKYYYSMPFSLKRGYHAYGSKLRKI